jgi:hypothetical protein
MPADMMFVVPAAQNMARLLPVLKGEDLTQYEK